MTRIIQHFVPHFEERHQKVQALILHCSAHTPEEMLKVLDEKKLSAHYIIGENGEIWQTVSEKNKAWHAGISHWREIDGLNDCSIGIELSSPAMGQKEYTKKQIDSAVGLCRTIISHYQIPACNVVGHSDIAPTRRPDPGKAFPWQYFASKGRGLWYDINDAEKISINEVEELLRIIGYDTTNLNAAAYAFCRHFVADSVAENSDIEQLMTEIYPKDFEFPHVYLPVLKACAYRYRR